MKAVLINPNLVALRKDLFTTGIVYLPIGLAYIAAALQRANVPVKVIDAFGENPGRTRQNKDFLAFGLTIEEIVRRVPADATIVFLYANQITNHLSIIEIITALKNKFPALPLVALENGQAVTAYSLHLVKEEFFKAGADYILTGDGEAAAVKLTLGDPLAIKQIDGLGSPAFYNARRPVNTKLDELAFPAWDLFPLHNYWRLRFAHGPQSAQRYLPLLTSRGCPYACKFCVAPTSNSQKWRARSAKNVVDEMEHHLKKYKVREFHIEDLNPTVSEERTRAICAEILARGLKVNWKIVAGTKAETIAQEETIDLMAKAGCSYISISPETGSANLLRQMGKPFNLEHAQKLIRRMNRVGIKSQACFVLGFPGETAADLEATAALVHDLTKLGVDEIVLSIITPVPGSQIYHLFYGYDSLSALNFSPIWRKDYVLLNSFRLKLYAKFILWKTFYHPFKVARQIVNFAFRTYGTKMEMTPYRVLVYKLRAFWPGGKEKWRLAS